MKTAAFTLLVLLVVPLFGQTMQDMQDYVAMRDLEIVRVFGPYEIMDFSKGGPDDPPAWEFIKVNRIAQEYNWSNHIAFVIGVTDSTKWLGYAPKERYTLDNSLGLARGRKVIDWLIELGVDSASAIQLPPKHWNSFRGAYVYIAEVTAKPQPEPVEVHHHHIQAVGDTIPSSLSLTLGLGMKAVVTPGMNYWAPGITAGASVGGVLVISGGAFYRPKPSSRFGQMADIIFSVSAELYPTKSWWGIKAAITGANDAIAPEFKFLRNTTGFSIGPTVRFGESLQVQADICLQPSKYSQLKSTTDILKIGADAQLQLRMLF